MGLERMEIAHQALKKQFNRGVSPETECLLCSFREVSVRLSRSQILFPWWFHLPIIPRGRASWPWQTRGQTPTAHNCVSHAAVWLSRRSIEGVSLSPLNWAK